MYTVYGRITSLQTGTIPSGSATFTDTGYDGSGGGCRTAHCTQ
jgi:hypothetical protein